MVEESKRLEVNGRTHSIAVKYTEVSNDWLVFLHGIGCAKECFDEAFSTELSKRFSILTFDFLGFGGSDKPDDFGYTLELHADTAKKLIEQFNPSSVSLVAHSMGGTIGTLLAPQLNNLVTLVNAEGNLVSQDAGIVSRRTAEQAEADFVQRGFDEFLNSLRSSEENSFRDWADWYAKSSRIAIHRSGSSLVRWSDSDKLMRLFNQLHKKAFIHGDRTGISHIQPKFENVDVFSVSNSGHFMMLDNSREFYSVLSDYLSEE
jgi:pimeloyl-ACP methyl ester carboxylesterase